MEATLHVLKYIGGKGRMAGVLSRLIPSTCKVYAEMYCGSAALALNSGKFDVKILNDFNPISQTFGRLRQHQRHKGYCWSGYSRPVTVGACFKRRRNGMKHMEQSRATPYSGRLIHTS